MALSEYWLKAVFRQDYRERVNRITRALHGRELRGFETALRAVVNNGGKNHIDGLLAAFDPATSTLGRFDRWCCLQCFCLLHGESAARFALILYKTEVLGYGGLRLANRALAIRLLGRKTPTVETWQKIEDLHLVPTAA